MVVCLTALVGLASGQGATNFERLGLVVVAMACCQLTIGWTNDLMDRDQDRLYQPTKPIPSGEVGVRQLQIASVASALVAVVVSGILGFLPLLFLLGGTGAGLAYNLGVKRMALSWLPYVIAFSLLPPFVWTALDAFQPRLLLLYPVAVPLMLGAHIANALPDIESDASAGSRGVVVILGANRAKVLLATCLMLAALLLVLAKPLLGLDGAVVSVTLAAYSFVLLCIWLAHHLNGPKLVFQLVGLASLVLVAGSIRAAV